MKLVYNNYLFFLFSYYLSLYSWSVRCQIIIIIFFIIALCLDSGFCLHKMAADALKTVKIQKFLDQLMIFDDCVINVMENIHKPSIFSFNDQIIKTIMIVSLNFRMESLNAYFNDIIHNSSLIRH